MAENPEDLNLPTAVVKRIVSDAVPPTCKVSKEANAAIAKAASVFVLYATSCSNNVAQKSHRKTLTGADVIKAIHEMEFDKFVKPLEASLESWKVRNPLDSCSGDGHEAGVGVGAPGCPQRLGSGSAQPASMYGV